MRTLSLLAVLIVGTVAFAASAADACQLCASPAMETGGATAWWAYTSLAQADQRTGACGAASSPGEWTWAPPPMRDAHGRCPKTTVVRRIPPHATCCGLAAACDQGQAACGKAGHGKAACSACKPGKACARCEAAALKGGKAGHGKPTGHAMPSGGASCCPAPKG